MKFLHIKDLGKIPTTKSLAIIPFLNSTGDSQMDYLAEGVSDNVATLLGQIKELKLASKTFYNQLQGNAGNTEQLAQKYGISLFLKGQLINRGQDYVFQISLYNTEHRTELWVTEFDLRKHPLISLPFEIVDKVIKTLGIALKENEKKLLTQVSACDPKAYDEFLKGKYFLKRAGDNLFNSLEYFQQAIRQDTGFAPAHAAYATNLLLLAYISCLMKML